MSRVPNIDWDHVEWLRSYNKTWDAIARDIGVDKRKLIDAYAQHLNRRKVSA